jgi:hypothetical protein
MAKHCNIVIDVVGSFCSSSICVVFLFCFFFFFCSLSRFYCLIQCGLIDRRMSTGSLGENNIVRGEHIGVVTATQDGTICTVDENSCKMFGYTNPLDLVGRNVSVLIPPPYKEQHDSYIKNFLTTGVKKIIGKERLVEGYHLEKGETQRDDLFLFFKKKKKKKKKKKTGKFPLMLNISTVMHGPSIQFVASMQPVSMNSVEMLVSKVFLFLLFFSFFF